MITHVRRSDAVYPTVHTANAGWEDELRPFIAAQIPNPDEALDLLRQLVAEQPFHPWLLVAPDGVAVIPPEDMAADYDDVAATDVLDEVWRARQSHSSHGYTNAHDDVHGLGHLIREAVSHVHHFGETPTDEFIRGELIVAMGLLHAAVDLIDRKESRVTTPLPLFYDHEAMCRYEGQWVSRVTAYLNELADLQGMAHDEEDSSTPEEAIGWAEERFKQVFRITSTDPEITIATTKE